MNRAVELIKCFYLKDPSGVSFYPYLLIMASSLRWPVNLFSWVAVEERFDCIAKCYKQIYYVSCGHNHHHDHNQKSEVIIYFAK